MKAAFGVFFLWLFFSGAHILLSSSRFRPQLVGKLGERGFHLLYAIIALVTFYWLASYYGTHKHTGWQLWTTFGPYLIARDLNMVLMALAFVLLVNGLVARPPSSLLASGAPEAYGVTRITRHPTFAAIWLFGVAHCLVNGFVTDLVFFAGLAVFSWVGALHQDSRKVIDVSGYAAFKDSTSFIPFVAILDKKQPFPAGELRWGLILLALILFYVVRTMHPKWFGGVLMTL